MKRILVFLRVSTEVQELDNQKAEMRDFCLASGYSDDSIIYVEGKGASAIAINDEYLEMYNEVKKYIDNGEICAVAVWAVNRLARDEEWFVKFKKMFIENKVQFLVKNPTLALLNPDGSVNAGAELALSLFSTMAKQEMQERKEKFSRTKRANAKIGKWVGGRTRKFGYRIDENNFFVIDENDGEIVRLAFQLYSTGEYSAERIAKELNERGHKRNDGLPINVWFVTRVLGSAGYTGEPDEKNNMRVYPALITKELFERCRDIATGNRLTMRTGERIVMGAKLLKCPVCGCTYTSNSRHFMCTANAHKDCDKLSIRQCVVDHILWKVTFACHFDYLMDLSKNNTDKYLKQIDVIDQKIMSFNGRIAETAEKKQRIIDTYLEGFIDKKTRDSRLSKVDSDAVAYQREINSLEEEKAGILGLLDKIDKDIEDLKWLNALQVIEKSVTTDLDRYNLIHQHILRVTPERMQFGKKDRRVTRDNAVKFTIHTVGGAVKEYIFIPKFYQGYNLYWYDEEKGIWMMEKMALPDNNYVSKKGPLPTESDPEQ